MSGGDSNVRTVPVEVVGMPSTQTLASAGAFTVTCAMPADGIVPVTTAAEDWLP